MYQLTRLDFFIAFVIVVGLFSSFKKEEKQKQKRLSNPNVVLIMSDDQGWGDLSIHGNINIETPNIDRLAEQGVQLDRFYVSPLCSPTRAGLLTGRYHLRTGVTGVRGGHELLNLNEVTIAYVLTDIQYIFFELVVTNKTGSGCNRINAKVKIIF